MSNTALQFDEFWTSRAASERHGVRGIRKYLILLSYPEYQPSHTLTLLHWWLTLHVWWTLLAHFHRSWRGWSWCRALGSPSMLWLCLWRRLLLVWRWDWRVTAVMWMMNSPQLGCTWRTSPSSLLLGETSTWHMEANLWSCNIQQWSITAMDTLHNV